MRRKTVSGIMLSLLLIGMLILAFNIRPIKASSGDAVIFIDPPTSTVALGETFTVNLTITNVTGMAAWQAGLTFNASILNCTGIVQGPLLKSYGTTIWIQGSIDNVLGIIYPCCQVVAPPVGIDVAAGEIGVLATVTFLAIGVGDTTLHIGPDPISDNVFILDETGSPILPFDTEDGTVTVEPGYQLTVTSSPITGIVFTINGTPKTTSYTERLLEGSYTLVMPEIHTVGDARYYWNQWSDGNTSRTRTVTMDTDITLTAQYTVLDYQLTITSSPITGIPFTINGVPQTTPYTEWLLEDSYTLEMPQNYNGYVWSHWLEDGDTNRIKTILLQGTTWTAVYTPSPVGGKAIPINMPIVKHELQIPWIWLTTIILPLVATALYVKFKKKKHSAR